MQPFHLVLFNCCHYYAVLNEIKLVLLLLVGKEIENIEKPKIPSDTFANVAIMQI